MKKSNKKGFTIVELVIVIAVIAILAAVLIPTFSNVIEKANKSAALQNCRNELIQVDAEFAEKGATVRNGAIFMYGDYAFEYKDGELKALNSKPAALKNVNEKKVTMYNLIEVEIATQEDAKCHEKTEDHVHAISVSLPTGFTFGAGSYTISKDGKEVASESWTSEIERGTIYFNIAACKAELKTREPDNFGNLKNGANLSIDGIPTGTYTYEVVANGVTYKGYFEIKAE